MEADIGPPGLLPAGEGELVPVGRQVPQAVERGRGPVGNHALRRRPFPRPDSRFELEPRGPQCQVIWLRRAGHPVHPMRNALKHRARSGQPLHRRLRNTHQFRLPPRDETPLILGDLRDTAECHAPYHLCNIPRNRGRTKDHPRAAASPPTFPCPCCGRGLACGWLVGSYRVCVPRISSVAVSSRVAVSATRP